MSFDSRSLERLQQLGRQLPQPLPVPAPKLRPAGRATERLHPIETVQDPERLFHELIQASPDGTVPPHLLQRLQTLEDQRGKRGPRNSPDPLPSPGTAAAPAPAPSTWRQGPLRGKKRSADPPGRSATAEHQELYSEFHQLLLEGDDD